MWITDWNWRVFWGDTEMALALKRFQSHLQLWSCRFTLWGYFCLPVPTLDRKYCVSPSRHLCSMRKIFTLNNSLFDLSTRSRCTSFKCCYFKVFVFHILFVIRIRIFVVILIIVTKSKFFLWLEFRWISLWPSFISLKNVFTIWAKWKFL